MNKFRFTISALAVLISTLTFASFANAQACRTWVSGVGDDANPCSRTAPCKTFAGAISKTSPNGEIDVLDPGGFGSVTITKAITIDGGGGQVASILVGAGTNGIVVQAGTGDTVNLLHLRFQGGCNGTNGGLNAIRFTQGKALNVINCFIYNFAQNGIDVALNQSQNATFFVSGTFVKNCTGDGLAITNANTGAVKATIEHSNFVENGNGLHAKSNSRVTARNSDFTLNSSNGIFVDGATGGTFASVEVWASQISGNAGNGCLAGNGGNAGVSGLTIAQNQIDRNGGFGVTTGAGGAVNTFTNNSILGNGTDGCAGCNNVAPGN